MRSFLVAAALALAGCTAVDDFGKFQVGDAAADSAPVPTGAFGEPCNMMTQPPCEHGPGTFTLTCHTELPNSMCTRVCDPGVVGVVPCNDYGPGRAGCVQLPSPSNFLCMPSCHNSVNAECPPNYNCCNMGGVTSGPGVCVPAPLCH
jgi:hypothetical protein